MAKRSKKLSLVLMGAMLIATPGCGGNEQSGEQVFRNQQECVNSGVSAAECESMEKQALENAPKFASRAECEKEYGAEMCSGGQNSGGNFWMPMLMGFMAGNMLGRTGIPAQGLYNNPANPGQFRTAQGQTVSPLGRAVMEKKDQTPRGRVSRGGFFGGRSVGA